MTKHHSYRNLYLNQIIYEFNYLNHIIRWAAVGRGVEARREWENETYLTVTTPSTLKVYSVNGRSNGSH